MCEQSIPLFLTECEENMNASEHLEKQVEKNLENLLFAYGRWTQTRKR